MSFIKDCKHRKNCKETVTILHNYEPKQTKFSCAIPNQHYCPFNDTDPATLCNCFDIPLSNTTTDEHTMTTHNPTRDHCRHVDASGTCQCPNWHHYGKKCTDDLPDRCGAYSSVLRHPPSATIATKDKIQTLETKVNELTEIVIRLESAFLEIENQLNAESAEEFKSRIESRDHKYRYTTIPKKY